jgi:hypothetical protein
VDYKTTVTDVFTRNEKVKTHCYYTTMPELFLQQRVWTEDRIIKSLASQAYGIQRFEEMMIYRLKQRRRPH